MATDEWGNKIGHGMPGDWPPEGEKKPVPTDEWGNERPTGRDGDW